MISCPIVDESIFRALYPGVWVVLEDFLDNIGISSGHYLFVSALPLETSYEITMEHSDLPIVTYAVIESNTNHKLEVTSFQLSYEQVSLAAVDQEDL